MIRALAFFFMVMITGAVGTAAFTVRFGKDADIYWLIALLFTWWVGWTSRGIIEPRRNE